MKILSNVFTNPRTTLAGILGIVISQAALALVPQVVAYLGTQGGLGWQVLALVIGAAAPALMRDGKTPVVGTLPPQP